MTLGIFLYSTKRLQRMGATHHRQNMKSCNRKTVETLKHWLSNSSTESRLFLHKSQCMSPHIYNIGMYTSPSWWTYQNTLFHLKLSQDRFPPTSKDIWETCIKYLHKHTRIHLHFKHCHKCQSDSSPGQSTPICLCTFISLYPKVSSQFKPKGTCSVSLNYQEKWPLEGLCTHQVAQPGHSPLGPALSPWEQGSQKSDESGLKCHCWLVQILINMSITANQ